MIPRHGHFAKSSPVSHAQLCGERKEIRQEKNPLRKNKKKRKKRAPNGLSYTEEREVLINNGDFHKKNNRAFQPRRIDGALKLFSIECKATYL